MSEHKQWNAFISYAREDKEEIASPLAELLKDAGLNIWIDEEGIAADKGLRAEIDSALTASDFGVVIASHAYFSHRNKWTQRELDAIQGLEASGEIRIITVCHNLETLAIQRYSPMLAGKRLLSSKEGLPQVASEIVKTVKGEKSPEAQTFFKELQRKSVHQFLTEVEEYCNRVQLFHGKSITLKNFYIPIEVTLEHLQNKAEAIRGSLEDEMQQLSRAYALKGVMEGESRREQVPWQEVKQKYKHIMVLADPGMGKSALLKMEAIRTAQQARQLLENKEKNIDEVILPLFLKLFDLTKKSDTDFVEAILQQLQHRYQKIFEPIKALVRRKLEQGTCMLLLDALDETPSEQRLELAEHLNIFARHFPCPMICTSRIVGYGSGFLHDAKEVEIVPFIRKQIEQYIEIWFNNLRSAKVELLQQKCDSCTPDVPDAKGLICELRQKPQIHGLAQNPLLLSLLCSLYQKGKLTLPVRRVEIYKQAVEYMLRDWTRNRKSPSEGRIHAKLRLLEELAYQFSCESKKIFTADELYDKIEAYLRSETVSSVFKHSDSETLINEFTEKDGIIQKLERETDYYLFLHRTFHEYFTASYLNRQQNKIELAKPHFRDDDWNEPLGLLAGLMDDTIPLIQAITNEKENINSAIFMLLYRCVAECQNQNHPLIAKLIKMLEILWEQYPNSDPVFSVIRLLGQVNEGIFEKVQQKLYDKDNRIKYTAIMALGAIRNPLVTEKLIPFLKDEDLLTRYFTISALGEIGDSRAVKELAYIINHGYPEQHKALAAIAIEKIGSPEAIDILIDAISHEYVGVKLVASESLIKIGNKKNAIEGLIKFLNHERSDVREWALETLERIGDSASLDNSQNLGKNTV